MKRQVIFDDDQLFEIVNESAKRTLRTLMTEDGSISDTILGVFKSKEQKAIEALSNGQNDGMLNQIGGENLVKLYQANPEAFQAISQDPMLLAQIAGNPGVVDKMASDPSFMTKLATNPNVQGAFFANGPEQAMNFFSDQNMVNIMKDPNIDPQTRAQMYGMMNGQVPMDPMMMQQMMAQYGGYGDNQEQGGFLGSLGQMFGGQQQAQMSPQQSMMMMQQAGQLGQQINTMEAQMAQMDKKDPNYAMMQANLNMLKGQMSVYARPYQDLQNNYNDFMGKMQSGELPMTPQNMQKMQMMGQQLMNGNMMGLSQYATPQQQASGNPANGNQNKNGLTAWTGKQGLLWDIINGKNNQQTAGDVIGKAGGNIVGNAKKMVNGAIKNVNANQRQQTNRRKATPAAATPAAAAAPTATGTGNTPAVAATPAPAPQAPAARGMTPAASQPAAQSLKNPAMQSLQNQNRALAGMAAPINPANLNLQGVQIPRR